MSQSRSTLHARRRHAAAAATVAAGVVHVAATGTHLSEGWALASGFLAVGMLQLALGIGLALGGTRPFIGLGTVGIHVIALSAWALSRTVGLPTFLHAGVEPIGVADAIAASMALAAVVLTTWRAIRPAPMGRSRAASVTVFTSAWMLAITGTAAGLGDIAYTKDGHHHAGDHEAADQHDAVQHDAVQHDAVQHDTGTVEHPDTRKRKATRPRSQPDRPSEIVRSGPRPQVIEEPETASTFPESPEDHTHTPGQEH